MSRWTLSLIDIMATLAGVDHYDGSNIDWIIATARPKIFDFDYHLFDEAYKPVFELKFLRHFVDYEICFESVSRWKFYLKTVLEEELDYFNQLYKSALLEFDPLTDYKLTRQSKRDLAERGETNSHGDTSNNVVTASNTDNRAQDTTQSSYNDKGTNAHSDTPENGLSLVENMRYLSDATVTTSEQSATANNNSSSNQTTQGSTDGFTKSSFNDISQRNSLDSYLESVVGKMGQKSFAELLQEYRRTFLGIDEMLLDALSKLFILVY